MEIKIKSLSGILPQYETEGSAGMDLRAFLETPITLSPGERNLIPTGLFIELPKGYEAQIRARSGLSIKHGLTMVNGIGTIDSDYRGELKIPMINLGQESFTINNSDRIAQMIISSYEVAALIQVDSIQDTTRSDGGFGHTGI